MSLREKIIHELGEGVLNGTEVDVVADAVLALLDGPEVEVTPARWRFKDGESIESSHLTAHEFNKDAVPSGTYKLVKVD